MLCCETWVFLWKIFFLSKMDIFGFLSPILLTSSIIVIFVFQLSFHISNSISDGFTHIISTPNCSSVFNIKNNMSPSTLHPHNVAGAHWLVRIPWICHLEFTSAGWPYPWPSKPRYVMLSFLLQLITHSLPLLSWGQCDNFFPKLNLKLSPSYFFSISFWHEEDNRSWHFIALCQTHIFVLDFTIPGKPNLTFF